MQELDQAAADIPISDIDLMARATYTWVRRQIFEQRFIGVPVSATEASDLAAGFLAGLQARMRLEDRESSLLAYVYTLMTGERSGAISAARDLVSREAGALASCSGYLYGLSAARKILNERSDGLSTSEPAVISTSRSIN